MRPRVSFESVLFEPVVTPPTEASADAWVFAFDDARLLVQENADDGTTAVLRVSELDALARGGGGVQVVRRQFLGLLDGTQAWSAELAASAPDPEERYALHGLRALFGRLPEAWFWVAARAVQIVAWDRDHQFCGRCGQATASVAGERSRRCSACTLSFYPRLAPAVIVLVHDGDRVLLARSPHFPPGMFSTLAGFVEAGESLEDTIAREIREEVGVEVGHVRYFGSQPWPFPHSLMVGFFASYAGGALRFGPEHEDSDPEIEDAAWFALDALPRIPPRISIARALIDAYQEERKLLPG